jgi:hypothetical protein
MNSKIVKILIFCSLALFFGRNIYFDFIKSSPKDLLKTQVEDYFIEGDDKSKLVWFDAQGKTISLAIEISGTHFSASDKQALRKNSRNYIVQKVCNSPALRQFIDDGNFVSVDIRTNNGFSENLQNIGMSKGKCV